MAPWGCDSGFHLLPVRQPYEPAQQTPGQPPAIHRLRQLAEVRYLACRLAERHMRSLASGIYALEQAKTGNLIDTNHRTPLFQYGHGKPVAAQHSLADNSLY